MDYSLRRHQSAAVVPAGVPAPTPANTGTPSTPASAPAPANASGFTEEDMNKMLSDGYIWIHKSLYDYVPAGARVRYTRVGSEPKHVRFQTGGIVRGHKIDPEGKKAFMISPQVSPRSQKQQEVYPKPYTDIDELWKKYDSGAYIEIHLMYSSLAKKNKQLEDLTRRVETLETILKNALKK